MSRESDLQRVSVDQQGNVLVDGQPPSMRTTHNGYLQFWAGKSSLRVNRVVAQAVHGMALDADRFPRLCEMFEDSPEWVVAHKNRLVQDNRPENLMWCPPAFNVRHSQRCPLVVVEALFHRRNSRPIVCPVVVRIRRAAAGKRRWMGVSADEREAWREQCRAIWTEEKRAVHRTLVSPPHPTGQQHPGCKLTSEQVALIRQRAEAGESHRALGREFGVSGVHIGRIVKQTKRRSDGVVA